MKDIMHRNTGLISAILALVLILTVYIMFGTVDVVFMQGDEELHRMDDINVMSDLDVSDEDISGFENMKFTYTSGNSTKIFDDNFDFRLEICKTVILNFITFKWQPDNNVIILNAN